MRKPPLQHPPPPTPPLAASSPAQTVGFITGQVNAAAWCLAADPRAFSVDEALLYFTRDLVVLAEKDEELLYRRLASHRGVTLRTVQQLRVSCINMLSQLMLWDPYRNAESEAVRGPWGGDMHAVG